MGGERVDLGLSLLCCNGFIQPPQIGEQRPSKRLVQAFTGIQRVSALEI